MLRASFSILLISIVLDVTIIAYGPSIRILQKSDRLSPLSVADSATRTQSEVRKEDRFVAWMLGTNDTATWQEVPHPGKKLEVVGSIPSYVKGSTSRTVPVRFRLETDSVGTPILLTGWPDYRSLLSIMEK